MGFWLYGLDNETKLPTDPLFSEAETEEGARAEAVGQGMFVQLVHEVPVNAVERVVPSVKREQDLLRTTCFTDQAERALHLANEEAHRFNHEYIGTEHILLGLVNADFGNAAAVLKNLGVDCSQVRRLLEKIIQEGPDMVNLDQLPLTPRANAALRCSLDEAKNLNETYVDTEHLLLGLIREEEGVACQVLLEMGISLEDVREAVRSMRKGSAIDRSVQTDQLRCDPPAANRSASATSNLSGALPDLPWLRCDDGTLPEKIPTVSVEQRWMRPAAWILLFATVPMALLSRAELRPGGGLIVPDNQGLLFGTLAILCFISSLFLFFLLPGESNDSSIAFPSGQGRKQGAREQKSVPGQDDRISQTKKSG